MAALPDERACSDSDEILAERLAAGSDDAFSELYLRYKRPLGAFAARLLRDAAAGEDVAQTSLLNAYQAIRAGSRPRRVRPWLYRIAQNAALDVRRRRCIEVIGLADEPGAGEHTSEFDRHAWLAGLRALPRRQRDAYLMRELQGLTAVETAARLGLSAVQVEQALFIARNRLAEQLEFGGRLSCEALRSLSDVALDLSERRAIKAHVRSCPSCRRRLRSRIAGVVSNLGLALRQLLQWLLGGGAAPVAAKVGAVAVTAAVTAAAAPRAVHALEPRPQRGAVASAEASLAAAPLASGAARTTAAFLREALLSRMLGSQVAIEAALFPPLLPDGETATTAAPAATPIDPGATVPTAGDTATTAGDAASADDGTTADDGSGSDSGSTDSGSADAASSDSGATDTSGDASSTGDSSVDPTPADTTAVDTTATDTTATDTTATDPSLVDTTAVDTTAADTTLTDTTPAP